MSRFIVPVIGFGVLLALSSTLIGQIVLRPWSGPDKSWRTHMNLTAAPYQQYTRSVQSFVSPEGSAPITVWREGGCASTADGGAEAALLLTTSSGVSPCTDKGLVEWASHGCANCHGLKGEGGAVGPNLLASTLDKITNNPRLGRKQMPAQGPLDLSEEQLALIAGYLQEMSIENPQLVPTPTPTPTPRPTPTPSSDATATVVPASTPEVGSSNDELIAQGKLIFEKTAGTIGEGCAYCHMLDAKGQGSKPPNIRGKSRVDIRQALINVLDMNDIKLSDDEITAVAAYLKYLNTQP